MEMTCGMSVGLRLSCVGFCRTPPGVLGTHDGPEATGVGFRLGVLGVTFVPCHRHLLLVACARSPAVCCGHWPLGCRHVDCTLGIPAGECPAFSGLYLTDI